MILNMKEIFEKKLFKSEMLELKQNARIKAKY